MPNGLPSSKSSSAKVIAACLSAFAILIVLSVLFLPMLFSTTVGKNMLVKMVGGRSGFNVEIQDLDLSWFSSQHATGVSLQNTQEQLLFSCQEIVTDSPLWKILLRNDLGQLKITAPQLQLARPFQTSAQIRKPALQGASFAAIPKVQLAMPSMEMPVTGQITIDQGKVSFNPPGLDPIVFDQIAMSLDLREKEEVAIALSCSTKQAQVLGQFALKGSASQLKSPFPNITVQSSVSQLPVLGIDQIVAVFEPKMNGVIYSALGSTIDMHCNLSAREGDFDLSLNAQSPQLTLQAETQSANGIITLKSPASLNFSITPAFFAKVAKLSDSLSQLSLNQQASIQTTISQFSCPISTFGKDLLNASFQASVSSPSLIPFSLNTKPLFIDNFKLDASSSSLNEKIAFTLSSSLVSGAQSGAIAMDGNINQPFAKNIQGTLSLNAVNFPIDLTGATVGSSYPLSTLLGPSANLQGSVEIEGVNPKLHLSWKSQYLNLPSLDISLANPITLISPASFSFSFNPIIAKADPVQGVLQNLLIPTDNIKNSQIDATLSTGQIALGAPLPMNIDSLKVTLAVKTIDQIELDLNSAPFKVQLLGAYNMTTSEFSLTKPLFVQYTLDNAAMQTIAPTAFQLMAPSVVQLSLDPMTVPASGLNLGQLKLKGQLSCAAMTLEAQKKQIALQSTSLPFQWDGKAKTAAVQISSQVQNPIGQAGSIQGQFNLTNFSSDKEIDFKAATVQGAFDLQNISSTLLDVIVQKTSLSAIVGPTFSSKLKIQSSIDKQNVSLKWTSANLSVDSSFLIDKAGIRLQGGTNQVAWTLTPESYKFLDQLMTGPVKGLVPFEIKEASTFNLSLNKLSLPIAAKKEVCSLQDRIPDICYDLHSLELSATGNNPQLSFYDVRSKESIRLQNLSFSVNKTSGSGPLTASLDSGIVTQNSAQSMRNGSMSLSGKLEETLDSKGAFDLSKLTTSLTLKVQQLPSRALDLIARAKGRTDFPFTTIFGDMINASVSMDLKNFNGPVAFNINTPMARVDMAGHVVNGALMLNDSLYAQMKITPEMSRLVLKEINPLNLSYIYSQAPVTLEIPSDGFYFPLYPFSMGKIAIPDATIELGKISCRNEGNVNIALGLLKSKQSDKNGELSLWFAPIDLSVKKGFVDIDRTEILLADVFDVCLWGKVDLIQDYVDMVLGLTAQTLSKAFGIKNLPENYVLTIPMKGKADNVQINSGKATAKVALLLAWQNKNVAGALGGGPAGAIVGEFLGKIATLPDADAKVPPPKHPFPWEIGKDGKSSSASSEKKRQFKPDEKPLKQILKVIR